MFGRKLSVATHMERVTHQNFLGSLIVCVHNELMKSFQRIKSLFTPGDHFTNIRISFVKVILKLRPILNL